jgi:hypothetical protein
VLAHRGGDDALVIDTGAVRISGPWRRTVLSEPENVGASTMTTSPGSTKALKASAKAWPEPLATMMFSGAALNPSKRSYL